MNWFRKRKVRKKLQKEYEVNESRIAYLMSWVQQILTKEYKLISIESGDKLEDLIERIERLRLRQLEILVDLRFIR